MIIGYNSDGIHDFAPYERLHKTEESISDFENLAFESTQFGTDWIYNFDKLQNLDLLKEDQSILEKHNLKQKDTLFEVYKLVKESEQNSKFSELFYEIRHKTYSNAWEVYKEQLVSDIVGQVFMSVTASIISATVEAIITISTLGFGWLAAKAAAFLAYMSVYLLMTKFSIDAKLHQIEAQSRSQTFYTVSSDQKDPSSLNGRSIADSILKDSMPAALIGHPGGYYTTVSGGEPGNMYTGEVLVTPPNYARLTGAFDGFLNLLWENFLNMGDSNPDSFTALDFDDMNLDFFLLTSELPSYNQHTYYNYKNANGIFHPSNQYFANTLGYLEMRVKSASNDQFDAIIPTNVDGRPSYQFINSTIHGLTLPQSVLYKPIVLSPERYNDTSPNLGHLVITVQTKDYSNTIGVDPYELTPVEQTVGYKAKIPLSNKQFEYPIQYISIDVLKLSDNSISNFAENIIIDESYYIVEDGNIYFIKSLEEIISEQYLEFETVLKQTWISELLTSTIYYNVHILFNRFIPDTDDETNSLALAQATFYTLMDYFNQYTYAEVSANMISEIAYTETLTFWSTLISVPLAYFGSLAATAAVGKMAGEAGSKAVSSLLASQLGNLGKMFTSLITAPIKEVFEEIIKDGLIESLAENIVSLAGGSDDLGFWLSSLGTSGRETKGALGQLVLGDTNLKTAISLANLEKSGNKKLARQIGDLIAQSITQKQNAEAQKRAEMSSWKKMIKSGVFKGLTFIGTALFFGGSSYFMLKGIKNTILGATDISPKTFGIDKTKQNAKRKSEANSIPEGTGSATQGSENQNKKLNTKPQIDKEFLTNLFKSLQESKSETDSPPLNDNLQRINPNPKLVQRSLLTKKFNKIENFEDFENADSDRSFRERWLTQTEDYGGDINLMNEFSVKKDISIYNLFKNLKLDVIDYSITINSKIVDSENFDTIIKPQDELLLVPISKGRRPDPASGGGDINVENIRIRIGDNFEGLLRAYDEDTIIKIYSEFFGLVYEGKPTNVPQRIVFSTHLILEAKESLTSTIYEGKEVIVDENVNWEVLAILKNKIIKGEELTKLERNIIDVAIMERQQYEIQGEQGDDNVGKNLISVIIDQVKKNKHALAKYHKNNPELQDILASFQKEYKFKFQGKSSAFTQSAGQISPFNLGKFFGVTPDTVRKWVNALDGADFPLGEGADIIFRKIRSITLALFKGEGEGIELGRQMIQLAIDDYMGEYYSEPDYITKISLLLDESALWIKDKGTRKEPHSFTSISERIGYNPGYLSAESLKNAGDLQVTDFSKYFELTTSILLLESTDFIFHNDLAYNSFRQGAIDIIFDELVDNDIFTEALRPQFDALVQTLHALTVARNNKFRGNNEILRSYTHDKNPQGHFTINQLSKEIKMTRHAISDNIKYRTFMSPEKVGKIRSLLEYYNAFAPDECDIAIELLKDIPAQRTKNRPSYIGLQSHPIIENLIRRALDAKGVESLHEYLFNKPRSNHRIDSNIPNTVQQDLSNLLDKSILTKLGIDLSDIDNIFIDYVIPSLAKYRTSVIGKADRNYQAPNRILLIPFYGEYSKDIFNLVRTGLSTHATPNKDKIFFLDIIDLGRLLNLDQTYINELKILNDLIIKALQQDDNALNTLEDQSSNAIYELLRSKGGII
ncbi:hypothetical protein LCGC14_0546420 [marine sediment metagenome]|uniref:Uncharacterized protein n=1 Tax=marine sediment metagenome TaxID=412755 RepID=A0A0F9S9R5_9ZZZZ